MKKMIRKVEVTQQDIWDASRPNIHKNKKKYTRKKKHNKEVTDE